MERESPLSPEGADLLLSLAGVGRRYGFRGPWVLRGVDLTVTPGALIRVEGANGTGKSTLLRVLAGIDAPTEGRLTGRPRTAYVPERFPAALPFTAAEYLTHLGAVHGLDRPAAVRAADEWLERFGAAEYARTPMAQLSKGSSQKVAVAQALLADPELLVLDEAWTGLDAEAREELERVVVERTAAGSAVVFVDHDPRRLAGVPDVTYAVVGGALELSEGKGAGAPAAAVTVPCVLVEARGRTGTQVPPEAGKLAVSVEETGSGAHRFTVPEPQSDTLLRALLGARPPWHVVGVGHVDDPTGTRRTDPTDPTDLIATRRPQPSAEQAAVPDPDVAPAALDVESS
ncbi:ABC transporter ATP-binding protein [Streptomyces ossamyceticus]|uniref:ABC transporter ATP-binding protein n=1 Tax=Streptomyces ossamyceticus TaxID=249581 RepID=UPI003417CCA6